MEIFKHSIKRILGNKMKVAILLFAPLLFILMFSFFTESFLKVGIVDYDQTVVSEHFINELSSQFIVEMVREEEILDRTISYTLDYSLIIEEGFTEELIRENSAVIKEYYLLESEKIALAQVIINNILNNYQGIAMAANQDSYNFYRIFDQYTQDILSINLISLDQSEKDRTRIALGFLVQFMLYMSIITCGVILEDKENGTFYRTFFAPVSIKRYYLENLLAFMVIAILQLAFILAVLRLIFAFDFAGNFLLIFLILAFFAMVCIAMGIWVVSVCKKSTIAYMSVAVAATPLIMLGGGYWPREFMPDFMQSIAMFLPTSWIIDGIEKLLYVNDNLLAILPELLVLTIFTIIFLAAGMLKKVDISD
ncbi:ABC transporter permease [Natronospora cellulosivora (SeqCode)]